MAEEQVEQKITEPKGEWHKNPEDFFKSTEHDLINRDASFHLLQPGKTLHEIMAKASYPDMEYLVRCSQCIAKLNECEIGEGATPEYSSGIELVIDILNGLPAIEGFNRQEFIMGLGRLLAPSLWETKKTGKPSSSKETKRRFNILKNKKNEQEEESSQ